MKLPYSPVLVITDNVTKAMKQCTDQGFPSITGTSEEIHEKLFSLKKASFIHPLVVGDINPTVAGRDIESKLLKVLEIVDNDIMFFSSRDSFSETFLSRFSVIMKHPKKVEVKGNSKSSLLMALREEEKFYDGLKRVSEEAPGFLPLFFMFKNSRIPSKQKITEFF